MATSAPALTPATAWQPLPPSEWSPTHAAHLCRRLGWSAAPEAVAAALRDGPVATVERAFADLSAPPTPPELEALAATYAEVVPTLRQMSEEERRPKAQELRRQSAQAAPPAALAWLRQAANPTHSPVEKWTLAVGNIFVVGAPKVRQLHWLWGHAALLRSLANANLAALAKAVVRSPAMIEYLDLQRSRREEPNENYARELFELFLLGEGNYTEADIKEAARAFTGIRANATRAVFVARQHDSGSKTIFGKRGNWTPDDVVDLALAQPAGATHFPKRLLAQYAGEENAVPEAVLAELGRQWRAAAFSFAWWRRTVFASRWFYSPAVMASQIKSPVQLYLGLLQDFSLQPSPLPARHVFALRQLGQPLFQPPNVRGWPGGQTWINSSTLAARRALAVAVLRPVRPELLNADDRAAFEAAAQRGEGPFTVSEAQLGAWATDATADPEAFVAQWANRLLPRSAPPETLTTLAAHLRSGGGRPVERVVEVLSTLLESPLYQLC